MHAMESIEGKKEPGAIFQNLTGDELAGLVERVFRPGPDDRALAVLLDLPDDRVPDSAEWLERRLMSAGWVSELSALSGRLGLETRLCLYRNVGTNNGDLPDKAWLHPGGPLPRSVLDLDAGDAVPFSEILCSHSLLIAPTEFSATAPLKLLARTFRFRAATMPGFSRAMIPALKLDYGEINRRVTTLKELLDRAELAEFLFARGGGEEHRFVLDLRHRSAHASGGVLHEPGTAGNLPSGEAYIVPYEGEIAGQPSRSQGELPVQFGPEVVVYRVEQNVARARQRNGRGSGSGKSPRTATWQNWGSESWTSSACSRAAASSSTKNSACTSHSAEATTSAVR
jgi:hypothetical protein